MLPPLDHFFVFLCPMELIFVRHQTRAMYHSIVSAAVAPATQWEPSGSYEVFRPPATPTEPSHAALCLQRQPCTRPDLPPASTRSGVITRGWVLPNLARGAGNAHKFPHISPAYISTCTCTCARACAHTYTHTIAGELGLTVCASFEILKTHTLTLTDTDTRVQYGAWQVGASHNQAQAPCKNQWGAPRGRALHADIRPKS